MRIISAHGPKRDFRPDSLKRQFSLENDSEREFSLAGPTRKFGRHNQGNVHLNEWLWGDVTHILSEIPGTFGDYQ